MRLRVLTWNLMHGRSLPPAGRDLFGEFATALSRWEWDVALLQEVPPWWPSQLERTLGCSSAQVLTSRNFGLPFRRAIAVRWPDAIKSNGGGCNAVLVRGLRITARATVRLGIVPERRWLIAIGVEGGAWIGNVHASGSPRRLAVAQAHRAAETMVRWAGQEPAVLGGDFNLRAPTIEGFASVAGHDVDHVFVRGLEPLGEPCVPERGALSDHAPVLVTVG
jgi:endonuclease/exonuclease/phosphatase family metal-dependent hydrolase